MRVKFTFFLAFLLVLALPASGQAEKPWWFRLEEGKNLFRSGNYGNALMVFEDARRSRLDEFTRMERDFILFLSTPDARRLGDSLEFAERLIAERRDTRSAGILEALYYRVPKASLDNSVRRVLEELARLKAYPEAEFWLGETYRAEGELNLAFRQYERAWETRTLLENSAFELEILYQMVNIHRLRQEYQEMENRANEIIEGADASGLPRDELWAGENRIRAAMARVLENEGVNRFLSLYRHNNSAVEEAHRFLGFYYYASNRHAQAAEHLMFAFLIQNTVLIDDQIRRQFDFTFSTLPNLLAPAAGRPETAAYLEEKEYYRTVYYLASALYATGKTRPSRELWAFLAGSSDSGAWGARARASRTPQTERAVEMP